ncbi:Conserved oligomeric Golgi complex subunit 6-like protein, partial [Drosera capensis]
MKCFSGRITRWVQTESRKLGDTDNPDVNELLKTAVRCLKERPVLFKYCAEVALASERELVHSVLDPDAVIDTGPTARRFSSSMEIESGKAGSDLTFVLDRIFEGVCRPFKLEFYSYTISDLIGRETALCHTLWSLKDAAQKTFFDILKARGDKLLRYAPLVAADLSPPPAVREGVSVLVEIIDTYDSMMVPPSGKKPDFDPVISALIDPIIQMCEQAAEAHKSKGSIHLEELSKSSVDVILANNGTVSSSQSSETPWTIFLINCLCAIQQPLLGHESAAEYAKNLGNMINNHIHALVEKELKAILTRSNLSSKMTHFLDAADHPLAEMEETSPASLSECLKIFMDTTIFRNLSSCRFQSYGPKLVLSWQDQSLKHTRLSTMRSLILRINIRIRYPLQDIHHYRLEPYWELNRFRVILNELVHVL